MDSTQRAHWLSVAACLISVLSVLALAGTVGWAFALALSGGLLSR